MKNDQLQRIEGSILGLSDLDKLELVERLVHELRSSVAVSDQASTSRTAPLTEDEFKQQLLRSGLMASLPTAPDSAPRPSFPPVTVPGEPLSETIIRERR